MPDEIEFALVPTYCEDLNGGETDVPDIHVNVLGLVQSVTIHQRACAPRWKHHPECITIVKRTLLMLACCHVPPD